MPMYTYECSCGNEFEDVRSIADRKTCSCPKCGGDAAQGISRRTNAIPFQLGWFEHIADNPVYIHNKRELREVCDRHECSAAGFD